MTQKNTSRFSVVPESKGKENYFKHKLFLIKTLQQIQLKNAKHLLALGWKVQIG